MALRSEADKPRGRLFPWVEVVVFLIPVSVVVLAVLIGSRRWEYQHDTPVMMYITYLYDAYGLLPYRDVYDMNFPGTHVWDYFVAKVFGYDDPGIWWANVLVMALIAGVTVAALRGLGRFVGWFAAALYALVYLKFGPEFTLQRDHVALAPLLAGVWLTLAPPARLSFAMRAGLVGVCVALAMTIKPHFLLAAPVLCGSLLWERWGEREDPPSAKALASIPLWGAAGIGIIWIAVFAGLAAFGILGAFLDIMQNYIPLYGSLSFDFKPIGGIDRVQNTVAGFLQMGSQWLLLLGAVVGLLRFFASDLPSAVVRRKGIVIAALVVTFLLYPAAPGQFFRYHYLPFLCFGSMACALALAPWLRGERLELRVIGAAVLALIVVSLIEPHWHPRNTFMQPEYMEAKSGAPAAIAEYLDEHLQPGDTVQQEDQIIGGVLHGLLKARARLATPFVYDFHFNHHEEELYIQGLKARYLAAMDANKPRFIVESQFPPRYIRGGNTTITFPEADAHKRANYHVVMEDPRFLIWERNAE